LSIGLSLLPIEEDIVSWNRPGRRIEKLLVQFLGGVGS
jgi:hypothetical protein